MSYFKEIFEAVVTISKGLWVTFTTMFVSKVTIQYPEVDIKKPLPKNYSGFLDQMSDRYRGVLNVDLTACTGCRACERACPIGCIEIEVVKGEKTKIKSKLEDKEVVKLMYPVRFDIDIAKCMYCGLCTESCPTGAIRHTKEFEVCTDDIDNLILRFVDKETAEKLKKMASDFAEKQKAALAEKQKAEEAQKQKTEHTEKEKTEEEKKPE